MNRFVDVLENQKQEMANYLTDQGMVRRQVSWSLDLKGTQAQIVVGIRRCGKSVLCRTTLGDAEVVFGYVDFDDVMLAHLEPAELEELLKAIYVVYGEVDCIFFDEIQNVTGWQLFVNRLLRGGKHIVITGSNSRLLTDDLATHLTGRHLSYELMPFSFAEYRSYLKRKTPKTTADKAQLRRDYDRYFLCGGLPEAFRYSDVRHYCSSLYHDILMRDVVRRHRLNNPQMFLDAAYVIMNNFACEISCNRLAAQLGIANAVTIRTYVGYLAESYLIRTLRLYGTKAYERTRVGKAYVIDPGFISFFNGFSNIGDGFGRRLENVVFLQLYRLQFQLDAEVFYCRTDSYEVDFLLRRYGQVWKLIQVSYDISNPKTRERELAALFAAGAKLNCTDLMLITDHESGEEKCGDLSVRIVDIVTWLLEAPKEQGQAPLGIKCQSVS